MATRKRNEWLDGDESDEEEQHSASEDESRSRMLRTTKRQKLVHTSNSEDELDDLEDDDQGFEEGDVSYDDDKPAELARLEALAANLPTDLKLGSGKLAKPLPLLGKPKKDKSGVIYLSRVPPFMKPAVLRSLLTPYGAIGRIFLTPESSTQRQQRLKTGGTRRKLFLDGWVEFLQKKDAKFVAQSLNAQTMGGKKRSRWHDEVWNIKYLSGVKWTQLVEQIQNENAERAAKLRLEISRTKVENKRFLENVEKGKMISGIKAKRKLKGEDVGDEEVDGMEKSQKKGRRSKFEQHASKTRMEKADPTPQAERVLSSIF
jgi:ESF2/ABP1 family protein